MGFARIIMGVTENRSKYHRHGSSESTLLKLETQLKRDGIVFVEDCGENITVVRWGNDLTTEEQQEIAEET